jgi:hypothetical protein
MPCPREPLGWASQSCQQSDGGHAQAVSPAMMFLGTINESPSVRFPLKFLYRILPYRRPSFPVFYRPFPVPSSIDISFTEFYLNLRYISAYT